MDDLTKLSGPELTGHIPVIVHDGVAYMPVDAINGHDRVWQRRLEHERDGLRERVRELEALLARWHDWADGFECNRYDITDDDGKMDGIGGSIVERNKRIAELEAELAQCKATMAGMHTTRGELQRELDAAKTEPAGLRCLYCGMRGAHKRDCYAGPLEAAERKAQEERRYGPYEYTLDKVCQEHGHTRTLHDVFRHLRETLATLDAVMALAEKWENAPVYGPTTYGRRIREVLNGKR